MNPQEYELFSISPDKEQRLFKSADIYFDASSLLNTYYLSGSTQKEVFEKLFESLKDRLWITKQTEFEFFKNREKVRCKPILTYNELKTKSKTNPDSGYIEDMEFLISEISKALSDKFGGKMKTLIEQTSKKDKHPFFEEFLFAEIRESVEVFKEDIKKFNSSFTKFKSEFEKAILDKEEDFNNSLKSDFIVEKCRKFFKATEQITYSKIQEIISQGELRFRNQIPPGYYDSDKIGFQKYADLISWKQLIENAKSRKKPVILVIDDLKEDWWEQPEDKKPVAPRYELIKELFDEAGCSFWMYNINTFLHKLNTYKISDIKTEALDEIQVLKTEEEIALKNSQQRTEEDLLFENSWEVTLQWESRSMYNILSVPLRKAIFLSDAYGKSTKVVGIIVRYDTESRRFTLPNNSWVQKAVVVNWYMVSPKDIVKWNQIPSLEERRGLEIKIPYEQIITDEIKLVR